MLVVVFVFLLSSAGARQLGTTGDPYGNDSARLKESTTTTEFGPRFTDVNKSGNLNPLNWMIDFVFKWFYGENNVEEEDHALCFTPDCVFAAADVLKNMNTAVDPCDNFYEFACGNFVVENSIPDDKNFINSFNAIEDKVMDQLRTVIEEPITDNEARPFKLVKDFYKKCMGDGTELSHIKQLLDGLGGWPVLDGEHWVDDRWRDWPLLAHQFKEEGLDFDYFIALKIDPDIKNTEKYAIYVDQPEVPLRDFVSRGLEDKTVQVVYRYMVEFAKMLGADSERAEKELRETLDFQAQLARITSSAHERINFDKLYNPMTIAQLEEQVPTIPWLQYISSILELDDLMPDQVVIVPELKYLKELAKLLCNTPQRIQTNYLLWQTLATSAPFLTRDLQILHQRLEAVFGEKEIPRWMKCVKRTSYRFDLATSSMYAQRFVKPEAKKVASEIVDHMKEDVLQTLEEAAWMDDVTRRNALDKADEMMIFVSHSEELLNMEELENFYQELETRGGSYLEAHQSLTKLKHDNYFGKLGKAVDRSDWTSQASVTSVNALYNVLKNSIDIPAAILQGAFFSHKRPHYMNFGAIGWAFGHESTHGFDTMGARFDKAGNFVNWWAPKALEAFTNKAQCFVHQYGNYTAEEVKMKLNGMNTLGEDIADNGGLKLAYRAYTRWAAEHGTEQRLPGLQQFTPQQMFWISAANTYCWKARPNEIIRRIKTDVHTIEMFRVLGSFSNSPEFAKDFSCPSGSKMNPTNKCNLW